ncbi:MAG: MBL fold metallo-hydrolase [Sphingomonas sp.]|jgi:L-ascorbate metabolism protein UlaG (beta-lactamase superfamily)|uniref:MBL fold metallo-hydrolase n=1 Tax=Sphingomonas sp. TaxID=28214 RepID=UPI0035681F1E
MHLHLLHQSAFVLRAAHGGAIAVDLGYEVPAETVAGLSVEAVLTSHLHPDHFHRPHLDALEVPLFCPEDVAEAIGSPPFRVTKITAGVEFDVAGFSVTPFASDHGPHLSAAIDNLGFAFSSGDKNLLFLGDMAAASSIPPGNWDAILIPVGGSKVFSAEEAAAYIAALGHRGRVVPIHFHGRSDRACGERFALLAADLCDVRLLGVGETMEV